MELNEQFRDKLVALPDYLRSQIFGQDAAVSTFADALQIAELNLVKPDRPKSMMLFLGPTGVGKTEICERSSQYLYGAGSLARINCSELSTPGSVARLIGSGPDDPEGILGAELDRLSERGGRIVLLDEIEKAEPAVSKLFLQMESAQVMLHNRRKIDLSGYHLICTSNLGTKVAAQLAGVNFPRTFINAGINQAAVNFFAQEVLQRFDRRVFFDALKRETVLQVARKFISSEIDFLLSLQSFCGVKEIRIGTGVFEALSVAGFDPVGGARPMRRTVETWIKAAAKDFLLGGHVAAGILSLELRDESEVQPGAEGGRREKGLVLRPVAP